MGRLLSALLVHWFTCFVLRMVMSVPFIMLHVMLHVLFALYIDSGDDSIYLAASFYMLCTW